MTFRFWRIQTCFSLAALHDEGASARDEAHDSIQYGDRPLQFLLIAFVPFDLLLMTPELYPNYKFSAPDPYKPRSCSPPGNECARACTAEFLRG